MAGEHLVRERSSNPVRSSDGLETGHGFSRRNPPRGALTCLTGQNMRARPRQAWTWHPAGTELWGDGDDLHGPGGGPGQGLVGGVAELGVG